MAIELKCYENCDDVFLAWRSTEGDGTIPGCVGYAIEIKDAQGNLETLKNLKGFQADNPQVGQTKDSTQWPFQTYTWTDHSVLVDTHVQFQVTAMMGEPGTLTRGVTSGWSSMVSLNSKASDKTNVFFNRGLLMSQFVARYMQQNGLKSGAALTENLSTEVGGPLMQFLSGELGKAIRGILDRAKEDPTIELYAALFELDLPDLIQGLIDVGDRAHVILANGAFKPDDPDENAAAAKQLDGKVDLLRRMVHSPHLAHNKFVVVTQNGKPIDVWTGSANWTLTGLHTQMNNGIAIADADLAKAYLARWNTLMAARNEFPANMIELDGQPLGPFSINTTAGKDTILWFSPMHAKDANGGADIAQLVEIVNDAKQGILFIMFEPGNEPLLSILQQAQKGIYVRGVATTFQGPKKNSDKVPQTYSLMHGSSFKPYALDVIQPESVGAVGSFLSTIKRGDFLRNIGHAITHSKVIVVDPFGEHPVVVTGSHNLSKNASENNDENLLILRDCPALARAYAVNCMSVYQHYRWPASQQDAQASANPNGGYLATNDSWQSRLAEADTRADLAFWLD